MGTIRQNQITKAALVTGGAVRIGRAIALDLADHGWSVAVHYNRSQEEAEKVVAEISAMGCKAVSLRADLESESDFEWLVGRAAEAVGSLSCLINNASLFVNDTIENLTERSWSSHLAVNLRAPLLLSQAFVAHLPDGFEGNIINMIDQRVWNLSPEFVSYTVSKSGLWTLTQTLAMALAPRVRVNGIGPGPTLANRYQSSEHFARQCTNTPMKRGPTPAEICTAVQFILASPSLTGQMIAVDGGEHLARPWPERANK